MPIVQLPSIGDDPTIEDVVDAFERLRKELTWLLDKNVDTKNARELGGWLIRPDKIVSIDGDVGMSTLDTAADDIRFFAGPDGDVYNFYVTKGGKLTATGALIRSTNGSYPNVEFNGGGNIFKASKSVTEYIAINPAATGSPALLFESPNSAAFISAIDAISQLAFNVTRGNMTINVQSGKLQLAALTDIELLPTGQVKITSWSKMSNGSQTLQQALDAATITSGDVTVAGGVATLGNNINVTKLANGTANIILAVASTFATTVIEVDPLCMLLFPLITFAFESN